MDVARTLTSRRTNKKADGTLFIRAEQSERKLVCFAKNKSIYHGCCQTTEHTTRFYRGIGTDNQRSTSHPMPAYQAHNEQRPTRPRSPMARIRTYWGAGRPATCRREHWSAGPHDWHGRSQHQGQHTLNWAHPCPVGASQATRPGAQGGEHGRETKPWEGAPHHAGGLPSSTRTKNPV